MIENAKIQFFCYKKSYFCSMNNKRIFEMRHFIKRLMFALVLLCGNQYVFSQVDTAFWFAVPKLTSEHQHTPITLVISTLDESAEVTVTKAYTGEQVGSTLNVAAGSSGTLELVSNSSELSDFESTHNATSNNGLYIHSTKKVNAYVAVRQNNSEIYALKGANGLGTQFFVTTQFQYDNGNGSSTGSYSLAKNTVEIIATENNTTVSITPSKACVGHAANTTFTVSLQRGQVYTLAASSQTGANHLGGTIITSDKPIVVDVSDDSVTPHCSQVSNDGNGCSDLVADQLVPESMAGCEYIVVPSPSNINNTETASSGGSFYLDYAFVYALENNTTVYVISGNVDNPTLNTYTMNRGDKEKIHFTNDNPIYIYARSMDVVSQEVVEAPIFVFQVTGAGREFGGTQLPPVNCTGSMSVGYRPLQSANNPPSIKKLYLTLLCDSSYTSSFQVNGSANLIAANDWHVIPFSPYKYCRKDVSDNFALSPTNMITFRVTNSLGRFHMGVFDINGAGSPNYDDCSISYFSNYTSESSIKFDTAITHFDYCQGETIIFGFDTLDTAIDRIIGPNGFDITQPPYQRSNVLPEYSGWYTVAAHDSRGCSFRALLDSIEITVHPPVYETLYDTICPGAGYFQNGFQIPQDSTVVPHTIVDTVVTQTVEFGCDSLLILHLKVRDSVFGEFSKKACNQYTWNGQTYRTSGDYDQTLTDVNGCDSLVTLHLEIEEPSVEIVPSGDDFCEFGELVLTAVSDYDEYLWSTGDTTQFISVTTPQTLYTVTVTQGDCMATSHYETPDCPLNIFLPSGISPSRSDGLNDYFYLPEYVHRFISYFDMEIYNRWGELVFKTNDMNFRWYGNIDDKGSGMRVHVSDVYVYIIHYERLVSS